MSRGEQLSMLFDVDDPFDVEAPVGEPAATAARPPLLGDQADRDRMATGVGQRVVAVAGAGSGKTTQLVQRVLTTLAGTDTVAPVAASKLAVITFTDKAARELIHRLRSQAAGPIDDAYVGTIHGFCASILRSFPIEAGLPPKFSTADEITSRTDAEDRARAIVSTVYDQSAEQPELREALAVVAAQVGLQSLPSVVAVIDQRWDQFEQLVLTPPSAADIARLHAAVLAAGDGFLACSPKPSATLARFVEGLEAARGPAPAIAAAARLALPSLGGVGGKGMADERAAIKDACAALNGAARTIVLHRLIDAFQPLVLQHARRVAPPVPAGVRRRVPGHRPGAVRDHRPADER